MKCILPITLAVALSAACQSPCWAQQQLRETPPVNVDTLMQAKLTSAQALIKGLALDDYELIARESQRLQLLSLDVSWNILQTEDYARLSTEFRKAAEQIKQAGDKRNLDSAGLGYFKLTMTCIDCHRHVRNVRKAKK